MQYKLATFAGGCFWCMVPPFDSMDGVITITSGYTGGFVENPTYEQVCTKSTGHFEAIQIEYDPNKVTYKQLLGIYWRQIDPTDAGGQFNDRGSSYKTAIFYHDEEQKKLALESKEILQNSGLFNKKIQTAILPSSKFYPAEDYHQDYYKKNPLNYQACHYASGREEYLKQHWK